MEESQTDELLNFRKEDYLDVRNFDRALNKFDRATAKYIQNCLAYFYFYRLLYEYDKSTAWPSAIDENTQIMYNQWKFRYLSIFFLFEKCLNFFCIVFCKRSFF